MYPLQTQILSEKFTQSFSLSITTDRRKVELMVELCNRPFFICPSSQNAKSLAKKFKYSPIWTISDICLRRNKKPTVGQVSAIVKSFRPTDRKKMYICAERAYILRDKFTYSFSMTIQFTIFQRTLCNKKTTKQGTIHTPKYGMIINLQPLLNHKKCLKKLRLPVHKCDILWLHSYYIASLKNSKSLAIS